MKTTQEKLDVLDLLIEVLGQHEKTLDNLIGELTRVATLLNQCLEKLGPQVTNTVKF